MNIYSNFVMFLKLYVSDVAANCLFWRSVVLIAPAVISSLFMKEISPTIIVETVHDGIHSSGW